MGCGLRIGARCESYDMLHCGGLEEHCWWFLCKEFFEGFGESLENGTLLKNGDGAE